MKFLKFTKRTHLVWEGLVARWLTKIISPEGTQRNTSKRKSMTIKPNGNKRMKTEASKLFWRSTKTKRIDSMEFDDPSPEKKEDSLSVNLNNLVNSGKGKAD